MSIEDIFAAHRLHGSFNICSGADWQAVADGGDLVTQHNAHLADLIRAELGGEAVVEAVARALSPLVPNSGGTVWEYTHEDGQVQLVTLRDCARAALRAAVETLGAGNGE